MPWPYSQRSASRREKKCCNHLEIFFLLQGEKRGRGAWRNTLASVTQQCMGKSGRAQTWHLERDGAWTRPGAAHPPQFQCLKSGFCLIFFLMIHFPSFLPSTRISLTLILPRKSYLHRSAFISWQSRTRWKPGPKGENVWTGGY